VVDDLDAALRRSGFAMARGRPSWMLRAPTRFLGWFAGAVVGDLVADQLTRLYGPDLEVISVEGGAGHDALARLRALETRMHRQSLPYEEWDVLFRQKLQVERSALRCIAGLADDASTGIGAVRADVPLRRTLEAVADTVATFRRSWRDERRGRGLGLVPFLAAAVLTATLMRDRRSAARTSPDLPAPDAHSEARLPKAA
jgi:hypothetical protein